MNEKNRRIILGIIVALQVVILISLYFLHDRVERLQISDSSSFIYHEIDNLSDDIRQLQNKIYEDASLLSDSYLEMGQMDVKSLTYPLTFCVVPKAYTESSKVYLSLNDERLELKRAGDVFKATIDGDAKVSYQPTAIIIENDGVLQNQKLSRRDNLEAREYFYTVFPNIEANFSGSISYGDFSSKGTCLIRYNNDYIVNVSNDMADKFNRQVFNVEGVKLIVELNDRQIETYDVPVLDKDDGYTDYLINLDQSYELKKGDTLKMTIVANVEHGFTYEKIVEMYTASASRDDNKKRKEWRAKPALIKDADGNVVIEMDKYH